MTCVVGSASREHQERRRGHRKGDMRDIVYILVVIAFFVLAALFVRVCNAIVGVEAEEGLNDERR